MIETLPPAQDLKELIRQEHHRAELQRLDMGMDGCGCSECQAFYKTIDLEKYGERVKRYAGIIIVVSGKTGADIPVKEDVIRYNGEKSDTVPDGPAVCIESGLLKHQDAPEGCNTPPPDKSLAPPDVTPDVTSVTTKIMALAGLGKSTREISRLLQLEGINISHMTVARRLQGLLV